MADHPPGVPAVPGHQLGALLTTHVPSEHPIVLAMIAAITSLGDASACELLSLLALSPLNDLIETSFTGSLQSLLQQQQQVNPHLFPPLQRLGHPPAPAPGPPTNIARAETSSGLALGLYAASSPGDLEPGVSPELPDSQYDDLFMQPQPSSPLFIDPDPSSPASPHSRRRARAELSDSEGDVRPFSRPRDDTHTTPAQSSTRRRGLSHDSRSRPLSAQTHSASSPTLARSPRLSDGSVLQSPESPSLASRVRTSGQTVLDSDDEAEITEIRRPRPQQPVQDPPSSSAITSAGLVRRARPSNPLGYQPGTSSGRDPSSPRNQPDAATSRRTSRSFDAEANEPAPLDQPLTQDATSTSANASPRLTKRARPPNPASYQAHPSSSADTSNPRIQPQAATSRRMSRSFNPGANEPTRLDRSRREGDSDDSDDEVEITEVRQVFPQTGPLITPITSNALDIARLPKRPDSLDLVPSRAGPSSSGERPQTRSQHGQSGSRALSQSFDSAANDRGRLDRNPRPQDWQIQSKPKDTRVPHLTVATASGSPRLSDEFKEAGAMILSMVKSGPLDPGRVALTAFIHLLPLENPAELRRADPSASESDSNVIASLRTIDRGTYFAKCLNVQQIVDMGAFSEAFRSARIKDYLDGVDTTEEPEWAKKWQTEHTRRFGSDSESVTTAKLDVLNLVGNKVNCLAAVLGSVAFLPFLAECPAFQTPTGIRRVKTNVLAIVSFLLRGGNPNLSSVSAEDRQLGEAILFAARVVLPYAMRFYLACCARAFDGQPRPMPLKGSLYGAEAPTTSHVQSDEVRQKDGVDKVPLEFGIMTGYEARRQPHVVPPLWTLAMNYTKGLKKIGLSRGNQTRAITTRAKRFSLDSVFGRKIPGEEVAMPAHSNKSNVEVKVSYQEALQLSQSYLALLGVSGPRDDLKALLDAISDGQGILSSSEPLIPKTEFLRQCIFQFQTTPTVVSFVRGELGPGATLQQVSTDYEIDADDDDDDEDDDADEDD